MKWFVVVLLLLAGVLGCIALLARPGAEASPDATITVDSAADNEGRDGMMTLREAIMLATGDLAVDALFILQYEVGLRAGSDQCPAPSGYLYLPACDVNCDGACNVVDALFVLQHEVGL